MKLKTKIILTSMTPLFLLSIIFCFIALRTMESIAVSEVSAGLHSTALSVRQYLYDMNDSKFEVKDELLYKGSECITYKTDFVNQIYDESHIYITVFYENVRYLTSLDKLNKDDATTMVGTTSTDNIYQTVVVNEETYYSSDTKIMGERFVVCYIPYYEDGKSVGMVFVGEKYDDCMVVVRTAQITTIAITVAILLFAMIVIPIIMNQIIKRIKLSIATVETLANGDLTVKVKKSALEAKDETGDITRAVIRLRNTLNEIVTGIVGHSDALKAESETLSANATRTMESVSQVEYAMNEIASGAASQAEETQSATTSVIEMGELVEQTVDATRKLSELSDNMLNSGKEVTENLNNLEDINAKAQVAIDEIYRQTNTTNESALKIQEATELITAIADETTLLALNASIEAARAGDAGKGFAVVASEIQKLAEQSNDSANQISEIIRLLISDSTTAVETMENVKGIMKIQSESVAKTHELFEVMRSDINDSVKAIDAISLQTRDIDEARTVVVDAVANLSAIAEENAASSQETSASIIEVNELTQYIGERAERLDDVSTELAEAMNFFTIKTEA